MDRDVPKRENGPVLRGVRIFYLLNGIPRIRPSLAAAFRTTDLKLGSMPRPPTLSSASGGQCRGPARAAYAVIAQSLGWKSEAALGFRATCRWPSRSRCISLGSGRGALPLSRASRFPRGHLHVYPAVRQRVRERRLVPCDGDWQPRALSQGHSPRGPGALLRLCRTRP